MRSEGRRRPRRSSEEVRALLIDSARVLFLGNGYENTTTKDIAVKAGVTEKLLFTNFGTKAELFEAAVLSSFTDIVEDYTDIWHHDNDGLTPEQRIGPTERAPQSNCGAAKSARVPPRCHCEDRARRGPRRLLDAVRGA